MPVAGNADGAIAGDSATIVTGTGARTDPAGRGAGAAGRGSAGLGATVAASATLREASGGAADGRRSTLAVTTTSDGKRLALTVRDNGPGLPPRARENLFQPFAGSARAGGTGLGLAIAREVARTHGGDIRLVETSGRGTSFVLELPAAEAVSQSSGG